MSLWSCQKLTALPVLILQQFFWPNCLRVLDSVVVQCCFHRPPPACHWSLWSIRFCPYIGSVSSALYPRSEEHVLYEKDILAMGCQCVISQPCKWNLYSSVYLSLTRCPDSVWILYHLILGRSETSERTRLRPLVLGHDTISCCASDCVGQSRSHLRVSAILLATDPC